MHIACVRYFGDAVGNEEFENIFRQHLGVVQRTIHFSVVIIFCCLHIDLIITCWCNFLNVAPRLYTTKEKATVCLEK